MVSTATQQRACDFRPAYTSVNVAKHWEFKDFKDFMLQVKSAAATARKAVDTTAEADSRKLWRQISARNSGNGQDA